MDNNAQITIIQKPSQDNPFIVLIKPRNLPSAPLTEGEDSAFTQAATIYPELLKVDGKKKIEHGLIHRIDTQTEGLILIASTQESYESLIESQNKGLFVKEYRAQCDNLPSSIQDGYPPILDTFVSIPNDQSIVVTSLFRTFGSNGEAVRPVTEKSGRAAKQKASQAVYTTTVTIERNQDQILAICSIKKGFRHQVRCHLAWIGFPVIGDSLYNKNYKQADYLHFSATQFSFPHPITKQMVVYSIGER